MVEVNIQYEGGLRCNNNHAPSACSVITDAPVDNNGKGASFSPTDLVATALGSCMATIMGIVAEREGVDLKGMNIKVQKIMSKDLPRRISEHSVEIAVPISKEHEHRELLEQAAHHCPVLQSIHPDIKVDVEWAWSI